MSNFEHHLSVSLFLSLPTLLQCEVLFRCAARQSGSVHCIVWGLLLLSFCWTKQKWNLKRDFLSVAHFTADRRDPAEETFRMSETPLINSWTSAVTVGNPNFILQFCFLAGGCQLSWQYRHFLSLTSNLKKKNSEQNDVFFGDLLSSAGLSLLRFLNLDQSWKHFGHFCDKRSFRRELFLSSRLSPGRGRVGSGCSPAHGYFYLFVFNFTCTWIFCPFFWKYEHGYFVHYTWKYAHGYFVCFYLKMLPGLLRMCWGRAHRIALERTRFQ